MLRDPNSFIASFVNGWTETSTYIFQLQSTLESESLEIFSTMAPPHGKLAISFLGQSPTPQRERTFPVLSSNAPVGVSRAHQFLDTMGTLKSKYTIEKVSVIPCLGIGQRPNCSLSCRWYP
jgi:hypothetical protein